MDYIERTRSMRANKRDSVRVEDSVSVASEAIISSAVTVTTADQPESKSQQLIVTAQIESNPDGSTSVSDPSSHPNEGARSSFR